MAFFVYSKFDPTELMKQGTPIKVIVGHYTNYTGHYLGMQPHTNWHVVQLGEELVQVNPEEFVEFRDTTN